MIHAPIRRWGAGTIVLTVIYLFSCSVPAPGRNRSPTLGRVTATLFSRTRAESGTKAADVTAATMERLARASVMRTFVEIPRAVVPASGSRAPGFVKRPSNLSGIRFKDRVVDGHRPESTRACAEHRANVRALSCSSPITTCSAPRAWCPATSLLMAAPALQGQSAIP
jgi:hypothetical protein